MHTYHPHSPPETPVSRSREDLTPAQIMFVDDESDLQLLIPQQFKREIRKGLYNFHFAENGREALDKLAEFPEIDLVISDINMPNMDGFALLAKLNELYPNIKAIMISAYGDMANIRAAMNSGAFDFICKPVDLDDLKKTITKTLSFVGKLKDLERMKEEKQGMELAKAHAAGKAEFASSVLHNIGNLLNSIKVSCSRLRETADNSAVQQLLRANELLEQNMDDMGRFLLEDKRGKLLPPFYLKLGGVFKAENEETRDEIAEIEGKIGLVTDIIETQQIHAREDQEPEALNLNKLLDRALDLYLEAHETTDVEVTRHYTLEKTILGHSTKLIHILVNLIKNAVEAMEGSEARVLTVSTALTDSDHASLSITDTGMGIAEENIPKMFVHGFTTKKEGHGFGLKFCKFAINEMGGDIQVSSPGVGKGATFTLTFDAHDQPEEVYD